MMSNKELLETAKTSVQSMLYLTSRISVCEEVITRAETGHLEINGISICSLFGEDLTEVVTLFILDELKQVNASNTKKLELLLGITSFSQKKEPVGICQAGEAPVPDPVEESPVKVTQNTQEKNKESHPTVGGSHPMMEKDVRRMYLEEEMNRKQIAEYYGVKESTVNNFLFNHDITRRKPKAEKQPDDKECA
jgi:hypothetical protein